MGASTWASKRRRTTKNASAWAARPSTSTTDASASDSMICPTSANASTWASKRRRTTKSANAMDLLILPKALPSDAPGLQRKPRALLILRPLVRAEPLFAAHRWITLPKTERIGEVSDPLFRSGGWPRLQAKGMLNEESDKE